VDIVSILSGLTLARSVCDKGKKLHAIDLSFLCHITKATLFFIVFLVLMVVLMVLPTLVAHNCTVIAPRPQVTFEH